MNPDDYVTCEICGKQLKSINDLHVKRMHNMSRAEYRLLYPDSSLDCVNLLNKLRENVKGNKNPAYQHGGRLSPFSKKFVHYKDDEYIKQLIETANTTRIANNNNSTTIEYYTSRGMSEEEAKVALTNRQTTFSLEKCIEKYGEELGKQKWQDRQDKWQTTLISKPEEEIKRINKLKVSGKGISKPESQLFNLLKENCPDLENQFHIKRSDKGYYLYDMRFGNKLIEFNGTFWHADPRKYKSDDIIRKTKVSDIWERDKTKTKVAEDNGYDLLVIWESDFKSNQTDTISKCLEFLHD